MSDGIRSDILLEHNLIRSQLANGDFKSLPPGSNIFSLVLYFLPYIILLAAFSFDHQL